MNLLILFINIIYKLLMYLKISLYYLNTIMTTDFFEPEYNINSFIKDFFTLLLICASGVTCATICISMVLYNDNKTFKKKYLNLGSDSSSSSDDDSGDDSDDDYENKYMAEYDELISRSIEDTEFDTFKYIFVSNKTPKGVIQMYYDTNLKSFCYYTNTKDIPYQYLETVGRFYVIEHDCKSLLINSKEEYDKAVETQQAEIIKKELEKEKEKELEKDKETTNTSIFARFKSYNTATNIGTTNESTTNNNVNNVNNDNNNNSIIPKNSNHYIYKGKLSDYDEYINSIKNKSENTDTEFEHLDYSAFKKIEENKKSI